MIFVWKYMFYMIKRDGFYDICMEIYVLYDKTGWFL